ncbi:hypothetical protein [Methylobacterium soli]|uniref:Antifreeze protein n=1 Tax=Methylobacterium soli TaxID=553447 RepID=A0A6L3SSR9_9HYPH|nr:hypothetical protein [Methylobacterium soli]KAB1073828.1 hypothetical protein F6X53_26530 [Methylobacterium soli]GJE41531.1 hypothetical protein AEGHOMDF_0697 [Methylobacterium soli]
MLIGARCGLGAALVLSLALGAPASRAQDPTPPESAPQAARPWTDPPVRGSTNPVERAPAGRAAEAAAEKSAARAEAPRRIRAARRANRRTVTAEARPRPRVARREARRARVATLHPTRVRPLAVPRFGPYAVTPLPGRYATPYPGAYPVGRVAPPVYGYTLSDDRARRIEAAQRAGYIVVHSRSVQFPDGRTLRTYRPYEEPDEED